MKLGLFVISGERADKKQRINWFIKLIIFIKKQLRKEPCHKCFKWFRYFQIKWVKGSDIFDKNNVFIIATTRVATCPYCKKHLQENKPRMFLVSSK